MNIVHSLVYNNPLAPEKGYHAASSDEWNQILQSNRGKPLQERRLFIRDRIVEGERIDDLYIESTIDEYKSWINKKKDQKEIHTAAKMYSFISLDIPASENITEDERADYIENMEEIAGTAILLDQLMQALDKWKPWASELLILRMSDQRNQAAGILSRKNGISKRQYQRRIKQMEQFIRLFLSDDVDLTCSSRR